MMKLFSILLATTSKFWNDSTLVQKMLAFDPPPPDILKHIQQNPFKGVFEPVPPEGIPEHEPKLIEGCIPFDDLNGGILCRNGPGRIRIGETQFGHWFDGDGFVTKLAFENNKVTFSGKYVQTLKFSSQQEQISQKTGKVPLAKAGGWTKRGLGKWWENLFVLPENSSNTNVMFLPRNNNHGNDNKDVRMLAVAEGGLPMELDINTLETIGKVSITSASGQDVVKSFYSAHNRKDPNGNGEIYNHGIQIGAKYALNIIKQDKFGTLLQQNAIELPALSFVHDLVLSENYIIFVIPPYTARPGDLANLVLGKRPLGQAFQWDIDNSGKSDVYIVSKKHWNVLLQSKYQLYLHII